jgi:hypothetical protein
MEVILDQEAFVSTFVCSPRFSSSDPSGMVYELLRDYFFLDDFVSGFNLFFEICGHIAQNHVPPSISRFFFLHFNS